MTNKNLQAQLDGYLTDTCNRYMNALIELGVVDKKAAAQKTDEILKTRNALLDEWTPFFAERLGLTEKEK